MYYCPKRFAFALQIASTYPKRTLRTFGNLIECFLFIASNEWSAVFWCQDSRDDWHNVSVASYYLNFNLCFSFSSHTFPRGIHCNDCKKKKVKLTISKLQALNQGVILMEYQAINLISTMERRKKIGGTDFIIINCKFRDMCHDCSTT